MGFDFIHKFCMQHFSFYEEIGLFLSQICMSSCKVPVILAKNY
jgi:hypothetical protein